MKYEIKQDDKKEKEKERKEETPKKRKKNDEMNKRSHEPEELVSASGFETRGCRLVSGHGF